MHENEQVSNQSNGRRYDNNPSLLILQMMLTLSYESSLTEVDKSSTVDN